MANQTCSSPVWGSEQKIRAFLQHAEARSWARGETSPGSVVSKSTTLPRKTALCTACPRLFTHPDQPNRSLIFLHLLALSSESSNGSNLVAMAANLVAPSSNEKMLFRPFFFISFRHFLFLQDLFSSDPSSLLFSA